MAEVFAGHSVGDHGFQKPVAIKRLLPELANDTVFVDRLIGEAKLLVGLQHGNIVSVLDLAREVDDVFLVMDFVDGPSLRQLIKARGNRGISLGVSSYIIQSAAQGLEFAHARPGGAIIHADISPSNLLLTTSGEVRVADFGIARRENTGEGVVEGKWAYMAPEQARGEALTPRSDVFALGVCFYELLTGQHPFGRSVTADEREREPVRVVPPRVMKPQVPAGLDAICMRSLSHDPRDRYPRMQALIDAIVEERFANGYREGAPDLAQAIRDCVPNGELPNPRTMVTERPVTIVTRSLLRELTPARREAPVEAPAAGGAITVDIAHGSSPRIGSSPAAPVAAAVPVPAPVAALPSFPAAVPGMMPAFDVNAGVNPAALAQAAALLQLRADSAQPVRAEAVVAPRALGAVVGGAQLAPTAEEPPRNHRWTIGVFGIAALVGVIAAIVSQLSPGSSGKRAKTDETVAIGEPPRTPAPPVVTAPVVAPPVAAPAPSPKPTTSLADDMGRTAPSLATTTQMVDPHTGLPIAEPPAPPPTQPGVAPTQPGVAPTQPGAAPTQPGVVPTQPGAAPTPDAAMVRPVAPPPAPPVAPVGSGGSNSVATTAPVPVAPTGSGSVAPTMAPAPKETTAMTAPPPTPTGARTKGARTMPAVPHGGGAVHHASAGAGNAEPGILRFTTDLQSGWANVEVAGQRGDTAERFKLQPGVYTVHIVTQDGDKLDRGVTIMSGEVYNLNLKGVL
jgi:serine/threonine-protein kinase